MANKDEKVKKKTSIQELAKKASKQAGEVASGSEKTIKKKITAEDSYFAERDKELIEKAKKEKTKQEVEKQKEERKALHYMKCPNCGDDLEEIKMKSPKVIIDKCKDCGGIWLDKGQLEEIIKKQSSFTNSILKTFFPEK